MSAKHYFTMTIEQNFKNWYESKKEIKPLSELTEKEKDTFFNSTEFSLYHFGMAVNEARQAIVKAFGLVAKT